MKRRQWFIIAPIMVLILGMTGYIYGEGYGFYSALLSSLKLLKVELGALPPNLLLEIARWIGIIFLFGLVYAALISVIESSRIFSRSRKENAVAVHGNGAYVKQLVSNLGRRGIYSDSHLSFRAPKQFIMFDSDDKTLDYFQAHSKDLHKAREVHLCLAMGSHISLEQNNVYLVNIPEVKAISYWKEHYCTGKESIAVIGSGQLAEAVLYWGLLTNVFDLECRCQYVVFGDFDIFQVMHPGLKTMLDQYGSDSIEFINEPWYKNTSFLSGADRIVLCRNTWDNISIANLLCDTGYSAKIHLFTDNMNVKSLVNDRKCVLVGAISDDNIEKLLLRDDIHTAGKLCHGAYMLEEKENVDLLTYHNVASYVKTEEFAQGYHKGEEDRSPEDPKDVRGWKDLDAFTRGSNYAAAVHDPMKYHLLMEKGIDVKGMDGPANRAAYDRLDQDTRDYLQEIEHIRWCRYHFLNNWKLAEEIIIDGEKKAKDPERRLHTCLVPYADLSRKDKEKDSYFYETLALRIGQ